MAIFVKICEESGVI